MFYYLSLQFCFARLIFTNFFRPQVFALKLYLLSDPPLIISLAVIFLFQIMHSPSSILAPPAFIFLCKHPHMFEAPAFDFFPNPYIYFNYSSGCCPPEFLGTFNFLLSFILIVLTLQLPYFHCCCCHLFLQSFHSPSSSCGSSKLFWSKALFFELHCFFAHLIIKAI